MADIRIRDLRDDLSFGALVSGVTRAALKDAEVRRKLNEVFEKRGLIVFDGMEPSSHVQVELSEVFGPMRDHPTKNTPRADGTPPGVIEIHYYPESEDADLVEIDGKTVARWSHWHFDSCYNNELNRAGVLRVVESPPEGGLTGFADGIQLYRDVSPELRDRFEQLEILYHPQLMFTNMRYRRPRRFVLRRLSDRINTMFDANAGAPRAIHPAVWQRKSGEKVLHLAPWQADGIVGMENAEGDALLEAMLAEIEAKMVAYIHHWQPGEMVIWDNWRFLHSASGHSPDHGRLVHRTTIEGDYGLGRFESDDLARATAAVMA